MRRFQLICVIISLSILGSTLAEAQEMARLASSSAPDRATTIRRLLVDLWDVGVDNRRASEQAWQTFGALSATIPDDLRWAYVLNQIHHDQYRKAEKASRKLSLTGKHKWQQRYTRIWLQLVVGKVDSALLDIQEMKARLAANPGLDPVTNDRNYRRLGRLVGFAEGPAREKATPSILEDTLAIVLANLNDVDSGNFQDERQQLTRRHTELLNEKTRTVADQVQQQQQNNQVQVARIRDAEQQIGARRQQLTAEIRETRNRFNETVQQLERNASPFERDLARLDREIFSTRQQASLLFIQASNLEFAAANELDPLLRAVFFNRAFIFRNQLFNVETDLASLRAEHDNVLAQLAITRNQIDNARRQANNQVVGLNNENRRLQAEQRRNQNDLRRLRNLKPNSGFVRSIDSRTAHLPTYDPFPAAQFQRAALK